MRAKWPRWLVPNCISKPSAVRRRGRAITPALLTSTSRPSTSRVDLAGARPHRGQVGQVERHDHGLGPAAVGGVGGDELDGPGRLLGVPAGHEHPRAGPCERLGGRQPEAGVGAGDQHGAARLVGDVAGPPPGLGPTLGASVPSSPTAPILPPAAGSGRASPRCRAGCSGAMRGGPWPGARARGPEVRRRPRGPSRTGRTGTGRTGRCGRRCTGRPRTGR